jgi:hypothetical protein
MLQVSDTSKCSFQKLICKTDMSLNCQNIRSLILNVVFCPRIFNFSLISFIEALSYKLALLNCLLQTTNNYKLIV